MRRALDPLRTHPVSLDQVDDLEAAEDLIGELERALRTVIYVSTRDNTPVAKRQGLDVLSMAITYCRPTCDMHGGPHLDPADGTVDSDCACPCHTRS